MADEDDVDIEGEFELVLGNSKLNNAVGFDTNELPSKSANLQPEFTNHPWMLEQGWSLDHCADEKSKATIEKMLLEEQHFINGGQSKPVAPAPSIPKPSTSLKGGWNYDEKKLFKQGLEIYGRSWTRVAELIPTRTALQVKNYAQQYFKKQSQNLDHKSTLLSDDDAHSHLGVDPLSDTMATVTTAKPTITVNSKKISSFPTWRDKKPTKTPKPKTPQKRVSSKSSPKRNQLKKIKTEQANLGGITIKDDPVNSNSVQVSQLASIKIKKEVHEEEEEDIDIEVDIDDDNDDDASAGLLPRSASPGSVYEKLLQSAGAADDDEEVDVASGSSSSSASDEDDDEDDDEPGQILMDDSTGFSSNERHIKDLNGVHQPLTFSLKKEEEEQPVDSGPVRESFLTFSNSHPLKMNSLPTPELVMENNESLLNGKLTVDEDSTLLSRDLNSLISRNPIPDKHVVMKGLTDGEKASGSVACKKDVDGDSEAGLPGSSLSPSKEEEEDEADDNRAEEEEGDEESVDLHENESGILTSEGEIMYLPNPTEEIILHRESILGEEQKVHAEFFSGRTLKTPERYLKIRNYITDAWEKSKPSFVNKTSVRPGLKNCGDVNCIGRIHAYLEQKGAINFGCEQASYNRPRTLQTPVVREKPSKEDVEAVQTAKLEAMRPRKRRVRDELGHWIDEKDLEGRTIEHQLQEKRSSKKRASRPRQHSYDPFQLVACQAFSASAPAPFTVEVESSALIVMDVHAHISKTEVIGLLGGQYNQEQRALHITIAQPCNSLSTGMQCEMDPVSQTQGSESILAQGQSVVGWYHSHPTFAPNPSIRDMETQEKFQTWFARGGCPFVGVIVSPYNRLSSVLYSEISCLIISQHTQPQSSKLPYRFLHQTVSMRLDVARLLSQLQHLADTYSIYPNRVELLHCFKSLISVTCLEKMLQSAEQHLPEDSPVTEKVLEDIKDMFTSAFSSGKGLEDTDT